MLGTHVAHADAAARDRAGDQVGAGLDAIGQHVVLGAVQRLDAVDRDRVGARAGDPRAHRDQEIREVDDFGLARGVLEHRAAVGERGGHHEVLGAGHGDGLEDDARALEPARSAP